TAPPSQNSLNVSRAQSHRIVTSARARKRRQANGERGVRHGEGRKAAAVGGRGLRGGGGCEVGSGGVGDSRTHQLTNLPTHRTSVSASRRRNVASSCWYPGSLPCASCACWSQRLASSWCPRR